MQNRPFKLACIGDRFGRLLVVGYGQNASDGKRTVFVQCDCGSPKKRVRVNHLVESTTSCGCRRDEALVVNRAKSPRHVRARELAKAAQ